jgi:hypothetical protein
MLTTTHYNMVDTLINAYGPEKFYDMKRDFDAMSIGDGTSEMAIAARKWGVPACAVLILSECFLFMNTHCYRHNPNDNGDMV